MTQLKDKVLQKLRENRGEVTTPAEVDTNMPEEDVSEAIDTLYEEHRAAVEMMEAQDDGYDAFTFGILATDNPHNVDILSEAWAGGYQMAMDKFLFSQLAVAVRALTEADKDEDVIEALDFVTAANSYISEDHFAELRDFCQMVEAAFDESNSKTIDE